MEVRRDSIPLQPRRVGLCTIEDLIPGGDVLYSLLDVPRKLVDNALMLVQGVAGASSQVLGYLLWQLGH